MTTEELLFCLLKNEICGTELPADFEFADKIIDLYRLSKCHDIAHLVGDALLRNKLLTDDKAVNLFKQQAMLAVYRYEQQNVEFQNICKVLNEAKIAYIPLKGSVIRGYYPKPWMRTSCDIDLLVKKGDYFATSKFLSEKLGYKIKEYSAHDVSLYSAGNVHIELHYSLIEANCLDSAKKLLDYIWDYATSCEEGSKYCLSDDMFYFYHMAHMAKHLKYGGCGIRPFIDLYILNHNVEFDKSKRTRLLEKGRLIKFAEICEKLSEIWFGNGIHDETTLLLQKFILEGGVYGTIQNSASISKSTTVKRNLWSYIWKPYREMKYWYPNLSKHKWLLPFYEIRRWFKIVCGGALAFKFKKKNILNKTEKNELDRLDKLISDLGLTQK